MIRKVSRISKDSDDNGAYRIPVGSGWIRKIVLSENLRPEIDLKIYDNDGAPLFSLDNWQGDSRTIYPFATLERVSEMQFQTTYIYTHEYLLLTVKGLSEEDEALEIVFYLEE